MPAWVIYTSMPLIAAAIGYITKRVAVEMMFRPLTFVGIPPALGWQGVIVTVFLGSLAGAVFGLTLIALGRLDLGSRLPFGVFLAGGALVALFAGPFLVDRYARLL